MGSFLGLKAEAVLWKKLARTIVCVVVLCSAHDASSQDSGGITNEVVIGGLGIMGKEILYSQWNDTFSVYLSEVVGPKLGVTFKLVYLDFFTTYEAVEKRQVDMVYTNPSVYACLEREFGASPIVSLRNRRKVGAVFHELDHFYGTIFVKSNSSITKIAEIENKTVEAESLIGLGACQLQWDELTNRGIHFLSAPRQVRFSSSQKKIVKDVIAGDVDIGMVRTDLAEAMVSDGEIEPGSVRVLENLQGHPDDPSFPFPYSTRLAAPEWSLAALPWTDWRISYEVSQALMAITPDHQAAVSGKYATWVPPLSYFGMHQMQTNLNWIDSNNKCIRAGDICETVVCPKGQLKKSCEQIKRGCEDIGEPCPEGYTCLCSPCSPVEDKPFILKPLFVASHLLDGTQLMRNSNVSEACATMQACLTVERSDSVLVQVLDRWLLYNLNAGLGAMDRIEYIWLGDSASLTWKPASRVVGTEGEFHINLTASTLGSVLLRVRTCDTTNKCTEESSFIISVVEKSCEAENFEPRELDAKCVCRPGFEQWEGQYLCMETSSSQDESVMTIIVIVVVAAVVMAFLALGYVLYVRRHKKDDSWQIALDELQFPEPRIVLGSGTYGQVLLAHFRSTPVAVKRVLPKMLVEADLTKAAGKKLIRPSFTDTTLRTIVTDLQAQEGALSPVRGPLTSDVNQSTSYMDSAETLNNGSTNNNRHRLGRINSWDSRASVSSQASALPLPCGSTNGASPPVAPARFSDHQFVNQPSSCYGADEASADSPSRETGQERESYRRQAEFRVKQAVSGNRPARACEMQLQMRTQPSFNKSDSWLWERASRSSFSVVKSFSKVFDGEDFLGDASTRRQAGNKTTINRAQLKNLTDEFMQEMQVLVFLRHPNIVTVMGAVVEKNVEPLMVMEHMKHGSLHDLMHNHTMQFDSEITMGVLEGIINGMMYLHSAKPPVLHNDLKSGNVLVGENFAAKLADFGLSMKRKSSGFLGTPFWMAPELLDHGCHPSVKTDVYSFGVTLYELLTRKEPYEEYKDVEEVIEMLGHPLLDPPLRPTIPEGLPKDAAAIMCACWHPNPDLRPSFQQIKQIVSELNLKDLDVWLAGDTGGSKGKRTANQLLYDVFPPHVADTLRQGKKVEPEHHDQVTIFFSDIVGFTDISRELQPIEVMDMLDRLYAKFDTIARKHDVFKVETIGDAYMAVANLVKEQSNHTERIAKFALEAVRTANATMIKEDRPELGCVNIRVGFHSGPVVSSVVGNMNPRFCLFGDTVNTSSRMESNSKKNKIHLSDAAADLLLQQAPGAQLKCRGIIPIKGKGDMKTFWLDTFKADSHAMA